MNNSTTAAAVGAVANKTAELEATITQLSRDLDVSWVLQAAFLVFLMQVKPVLGPVLLWVLVLIYFFYFAARIHVVGKCLHQQEKHD